MVIHTLATIILVLTLNSWFNQAPFWKRVPILITGYLLYFYNPLLLVYSYEVRFYGLLFLGGVIVAALFYKGKLFSPSYFPLVLLFCLNSVLHTLILVPLFVYGIWVRSTRKLALTLLCALAVLSAVVVPNLYIPNALPEIHSSERIIEGLSLLKDLYLDTGWKFWAMVTSIIILSIFRRKNALLLVVASVFYIVVLSVFNNIYNYRYFGAKHFIIILPLCTFALLELFAVTRNFMFRMGVGCVIAIVFLYPFYGHVRAIQDNKLLVSKDPLGLKYIFQYALEKNVQKIVVNYGDATYEEVEYNQISVDWYTQHYTMIELIESHRKVCEIPSVNISTLFYIARNVAPCPNNTGIIIRDTHGARFFIARNDD